MRSNSFSAKAELPRIEYYNFSVCTVGETVFLVGGVDRGKWTKEVFALVPGSGRWYAERPMLLARRRTAALAIPVNIAS